MFFFLCQSPVTFAREISRLPVASSKVSVIVKHQLVTFNRFPFDLDVKLLKRLEISLATF